MRFIMVVLMVIGTNVAADTEIYRCSLEDGTFAFQETPCPESADDAVDNSESDESTSEKQLPAAEGDRLDFVNPFDEPAILPPQDDEALPEPVSHDRAECEKMTRDAIDAIDLEMRQTAYSKEQGQEYLAELRVLTRQLRACKQL